MVLGRKGGKGGFRWRFDQGLTGQYYKNGGQLILVVGLVLVGLWGLHGSGGVMG